MPPKAGGKKTKEDKPAASGTAAAAPGADFPAIPEELLVRHPQRWVQVHFRLLTVGMLNDVVRLPQSATLHSVESHLISHHGGGIAKLVLWKDDVQPKNMLKNFSMTLKEVWNLNDAEPRQIQNPNPSSLSSGVRRFGAYGEPEDHQVVVAYEYKAHKTDSMLVMRSPRYAVEGFTGGTKTRGFIGLADAEAEQASKAASYGGGARSGDSAPTPPSSYHASPAPPL